jgi:hypothetical protein
MNSTKIAPVEVQTLPATCVIEVFLLFSGVIIRYAEGCDGACANVPAQKPNLAV